MGLLALAGTGLQLVLKGMSAGPTIFHAAATCLITLFPAVYAPILLVVSGLGLGSE